MLVEMALGQPLIIWEEAEEQGVLVKMQLSQNLEMVGWVGIMVQYLEQQ
jgi:hypothetical protein